VWTIVPEGEPRGKLLVRLFWQTTSLERVLNQGFKFMEVENPSLLSKLSLRAEPGVAKAA
jgi:hypothetical protein